MTQWYQLKEQSAGTFRLSLLWALYKIMGLKGLKLILIPIVGCITLCAPNARSTSKQYLKILNTYQKNHHLNTSKFSSFKHILNYAWSLADKMSAICDPKSPIKFQIMNDKEWTSFQKNIQKNNGIYLISSHLGNIETFCAFDKTQKIHKKVHALMEVNQNNIFHHFIMKKTTNTAFQLYATEQINFDTIMQLYEFLCAGDILLMAGDRIAAHNPSHTITTKLLDKKCHLPTGTFKFAQKMNHPTYAIVAIYLGHNTYQIQVKQIATHDTPQKMAQSYITFIQQQLLRHPDQWYNFYSYFD